MNVTGEGQRWVKEVRTGCLEEVWGTGKYRKQRPQGSGGCKKKANEKRLSFKGNSAEKNWEKGDGKKHGGRLGGSTVKVV